MRKIVCGICINDRDDRDDKMRQDVVHEPRIKPFLKWAGGKGQLIPEILKRLPSAIAGNNTNKTAYFEPFVGGGAVYSHLNSMHLFENCLICDINPCLCNAYFAVKHNPTELLEILENFAAEYLPLDSQKRKECYLKHRDSFNGRLKQYENTSNLKPDVHSAAELIFLNRTCFNGLYRVNSDGLFNVPHGRYVNPKIANRKLIESFSRLLSNTEIYCGDFTLLEDSIKEHGAGAFVYLDPPYRPLSKTASFNSYAADTFDDASQKRLAGFFRRCSDAGARLMLSNSDPKNTDPDDNFFDDLYDGFVIERVKASRRINSDAGKRGEINEIIIRNYKD